MGWLLGLALAAGVVASALATETIRVGSLTLQRCNEDFGGYCGSICRPLDVTGTIAGATELGFEWYPRDQQSQPALGMVLTIEGGPGYASTDVSNYTGAGLRGRRFSFDQFADGYLFTLRRLRWVDDLAVSGRLGWSWLALARATSS